MKMVSWVKHITLEKNKKKQKTATLCTNSMLYASITVVTEHSRSNKLPLLMSIDVYVIIGMGERIKIKLFSKCLWLRILQERKC